jgi:hypothetical protein
MFLLSRARHPNAATYAAVVASQVGASQAMLLGKLGVRPFSYGLVFQQVRRPPSFTSLTPQPSRTGLHQNNPPPPSPPHSSHTVHRTGAFFCSMLHAACARERAAA